ncbi:MAG TPA: hypothetical protein VGN72_01185 [Tepidisphaeraceae bacterium]|jgi:CHASE3 domain sensor protein|nr:hypothetical protein [Tepidisphaeraceae bacterium]
MRDLIERYRAMPRREQERFAALVIRAIKTHWDDAATEAEQAAKDAATRGNVQRVIDNDHARERYDHASQMIGRVPYSVITAALVAHDLATPTESPR